MITKIISGGQTGADRAALDAAALLGVETGGTAPKGYRICNWVGSDGEDWSLADLGLVQHSSRQYPPRTKQNVLDADATVIYSNNRNSPGSRLTERCCVDAGKRLLINPSQEKLRAWVQEGNPRVLNVAGSRLSVDNPYIYSHVFQEIYNLLMFQAYLVPGGL